MASSSKHERLELVAQVSRHCENKKEHMHEMEAVKRIPSLLRRALFVGSKGSRRGEPGCERLQTTMAKAVVTRAESA